MAAREALDRPRSGSNPGSPATVRPGECLQQIGAFPSDGTNYCSGMPRPSPYTEDEVRAAVAESPSLTAALRASGLQTSWRKPQDVPPADRALRDFDRPLRSQLGTPGSKAKEGDTASRVWLRLDVQPAQPQRAPLRDWAAVAAVRAVRAGRGVARSPDVVDPRSHQRCRRPTTGSRTCRIVCPNCAATLDTHCGRKNRRDRGPRPCLLAATSSSRSIRAIATARRCCGTHNKGPRAPRPERRKVERPSYEQLMADVASMSFLAIGRKYGVSDNAVRKWIRWYEYQREMEEWRDEEARTRRPAA